MTTDDTDAVVCSYPSPGKLHESVFILVADSDQLFANLDGAFVHGCDLAERDNKRTMHTHKTFRR